MKENRFGRVQTFVGMSILFMLLLSALALGANRPVSWSLLSIGVLVIFSLQVLIAMALPVPLAVRKAMLPVLLFLAAISWAWVQVLPSMPQNLVHPVWSLVPDAPAFISADPGQGRHAVMRLICYAMIFAVMLCTCSKTERASLALKIIAIFSVRRQSFWHQRRPKLRECFAHLVGLIMRRVVCDASVAFRASFV